MKMSKILPRTHWPQPDLPLASSAEAFPAKILALLEKVRALPARARGYGASSLESFASLCPTLHWWKTSQLSLDGGSVSFSETWPRSGMTRNGTAYRLPMLASDTFGIEFGLWPTPNATAFKGGRLSPRKGSLKPERNNWQDFCSLELGLRYPPPPLTELVMGFPVTFTEITR